MFSKTEVLKRLREATRKRYPNARSRFEIGYRTNQKQHVFPDGISDNDYWKWYDESGSDLQDFGQFHTKDITDDIRRYGSVIHVYVSIYRYGDWDLDDVLTIWIGTPTEQPVFFGD